MSNQFCTSCGYALAMDAKFCENCGAIFNGSVTADSKTIAGPTTREAVAKHARVVVGAWVMPFNATLVFGSTLVAVFDFLSPRILLLPTAATVAVVGLLTAFALRKYVAPNLPQGSALRRTLAPETGLHKSPVLIATGLLSALMVSGAAWSSAESSRGGVIASKFDAARNAQMQLGVMQSLQKEQKVQTAVLEDIREGRSSDPRRELTNLGEMWESYSFQAALARGDLRVSTLFIDGGMDWRISDAFVVISLKKPQMLSFLQKHESRLTRLDEDCVNIIDHRIVANTPVLMFNSRDLENGFSYKPFQELSAAHKEFLKVFCKRPEDVASINRRYKVYQQNFQETKKLMGGYVGPATNESNRQIRLYEDIVKLVN